MPEPEADAPAKAIGLKRSPGPKQNKKFSRREQQAAGSAIMQLLCIFGPDNV